MAWESAEEREYLVLDCLRQIDGPVGSGVVSEYLRSQGQSVSEATVGRLLRGFDAAGYTTRAGFQGRCLTEAGRSRHYDLQQNRTFRSYSTELREALSAHNDAEIIDLLIARKTVERGVARLAAANVTPIDIADLEELRVHYTQAGTAARIAQLDMDFHQMLARIANNRFLQAATRLVHGEVVTRPLPPAISLRLHPMMCDDHRRIVAAIRAQDLEAAEQAMVRHIDQIIQALKDLVANREAESH